MNRKQNYSNRLLSIQITPKLCILSPSLQYCTHRGGSDIGCCVLGLKELAEFSCIYKAELLLQPYILGPVDQLTMGFLLEQMDSQLPVAKN